MNEYLNLLDNIDTLSTSEKRILLSITTYLNEDELDEFEKFNKDLNISIKDSLKLNNISINNEKIRETLMMLKKYV